jgi:CheY-like chemotaxis protein
MRIVIAEDSAVVRAGLVEILADRGHEGVAAVGNAEDLRAAVDEYQQDVTAVDVRMPPGYTDEGLRAAIVIRRDHPKTGVLVFSQYIETRYAVVVATCAQRMREDQADRLPRAPVARRARDATAGLTVTRLADRAGVVSFAGTSYAAGRGWARTAIDVSIVAGSVQLSRDGKVIRVHPIRHDRARELGAFANPKGRPRRKNSAAGTVA